MTATLNRRAVLAVKRGAALLDKKGPRGWRRKIRRRTLDLSHGCNCVPGQLYGDFDGGLDRLNLDALGAERHGFEEPWGPALPFTYDDLDAAWRAHLRQPKETP